MYFCNECGLEFKIWQQKANHIRWNHNNFNYDQYIYKLKNSINNSLRNKKGEYINEIRKCDNIKGCDNTFNVVYRQSSKKKKYYCSRYCANTRIHSEETKKKFSDLVKFSENHKIFRNNAGNINNKKQFSSKTERYIVSYFRENFINDEWKFGGGLKIDGVNISRDLWSDKLKICFEYDDIWHFKNIHNQLDNKKFKDNLLEKWCIFNEYRLVRIDENFYKNIWQIIDLIYKRTDSILKIGNRY